MRLPGLPLTINARTVVPAAPWEVFEFLTDPVNQCMLADRLGRAGCTDMRLLGANRPRNLLMLVDPPESPRAFVLWELVSANGEHADPIASLVHLQIVFESRTLRDRLRMIAGGGGRLRERANVALRELARAVGSGPEPRAAAASS